MLASKPSPKTVTAPPEAPPSAVDAVMTNKGGLVLFGGELPTALSGLGLERYHTRESVGVAPTWKPVRAGDTIIGEVTRYKKQEDMSDKVKSDAIIITGPHGHATVWLGADLSSKITPEWVGKIVVIYFDGELEVGRGPSKMKTYRVIEVVGPRT